MNKQELIRAVAARGGLRVTDAAKAMSAFGDILKICMAEGERITWPGVGSFFSKECKARRGHNPATGTAITIPARKSVKFSPRENPSGGGQEEMNQPEAGPFFPRGHRACPGLL